MFPKRQLIELLFDLEHPDVEQVRQLLDELNIGAVVTKAEHRLLGGVNGYRDDAWKRYRKANVEWVDLCQAWLSDLT